MSSIDVHRQHYNVTFALLALAAVAFSLLQSLVAPARLTIQHDLHTTTAGAAWILSAYLLSASVVTPIAGRLGDMLGKKLVLVAVLLVLATGTIGGAIGSQVTAGIVTATVARNGLPTATGFTIAFAASAAALAIGFVVALGVPTGAAAADRVAEAA